MNTDTIAYQAEELAKSYKASRDRYARTSPHYQFNDGRYWAMRDFAKTLREGESVHTLREVPGRS